MKHILFILIATCISFISTAQSSTDTVVTTIPNFFDTYSIAKEGYANINIEQEKGIEEIVSKHIALNIQNESKIQGWRIQIYNSSGAESRKEAQDVRNKFLAKYPEYAAYLIYQPPFFKIRVGDFRTREDAYMIYKQIIQEFPVSYLVNDMINLPKL